MYKAFQDEKHYLAFDTFPKTAKGLSLKSKAYATGFRKWISDDMITYALVLGTFRVMFGIKTPFSCCEGQKLQ